MAKVSFGTLKLKKQETTTTIKIADKDVEVLNYLPIEDKYDLIQATLQQSAEGIGFNEILIEMNFYLNVVFLYSNISFTETQKEDRYKLYDILESNGVINEIINAIPVQEFKSLMDSFDLEKKRVDRENRSSAGILNNIINKLPNKAQETSDILKNINFEDMKDVVNFANELGINIPKISSVK